MENLSLADAYAGDLRQVAENLTKGIAAVAAPPNAAIGHADEKAVRFRWVAGDGPRRGFEMAGQPAGKSLPGFSLVFASIQRRVRAFGAAPKRWRHRRRSRQTDFRPRRANR